MMTTTFKALGGGVMRWSSLLNNKRRIAEKSLFGTWYIREGMGEKKTVLRLLGDCQGHDAREFIA